MAIKWDSMPNTVKRAQLWNELRSLLTPEKYEAGKWTLTELVMGSDGRIHRALEVLDGLGVDGKRQAGIMQPRVNFRFQVLSRQACCKDKKGRKIWFKKQSLENSDTDDDIVAKPDDKPKTGDIVEWKADAKQYDDEGLPISAKVKRKWAYLGIRADNYVEFPVDKDGCISVPYPWAYSMLKKFGKKISKPKFRKKTKRQITNWFFQEVHMDYRKTKPGPAPMEENKNEQQGSTCL